MKARSYKYKDKFTVMQDNKGVTVIEFEGPLCRLIDAYQIPLKGQDVIVRAGLVIDGDDVWDDFVAAITTASEAFSKDRHLVLVE